MNLEWTLFQFPLKNTKNSSEFLIKTNKHTYTMSGRGKGKSSKKAVSRSAKAGLQFPVGRIARYVICIVYILHSMRARYGWCILEKMWNATVPRIIDFEITNADLY